MPTKHTRLKPEERGWGGSGRDHRNSTSNPFIEGAWRTKHGGRYYLQYGAPGTEFRRCTSRRFLEKTAAAKAGDSVEPQ